ncbi:NAD(P) transhydrogenase subunit alpha [Rubrobacter taiwanensis]|jgi:NAD(P) transhydrogenase subunit alpha|uniref:proton-translocating NAD(P)(+) transhydrogenase n=1 Tax=Rubrobacter taiwanensis TaxID=185139 RepID=A0A4R1BQY3_9ACTN|nr:NAD(P) transhydrogenase subunit alpha [Rubrobacter taiwanensis]TCJ19706.1 NAD(P) transhydrogenase subunit alpha [Rubrobacter taiwanensis]
MKVGIVREARGGENRVALVPETVEKLVRDGFEVLVESGAGREYHPDEEYREAGARVAESAGEVFGSADIVLKVQRPTQEELPLLREGSVLITSIQPAFYPELVQRIAAAGVTLFSMDLIPRITRAQAMDTLSSMASLAGYKAVLLGANALGKYLPMMTTAAGTTRAAKVLVLGAGVAGLQAIATARRLGAEVEAFDIRPETKEQIESLGARFLESAEPGGAAAEEEEVVEEERVLSPFARLMVALGFYSFAERDGKEEGPEAGIAEEAESGASTGGYATVQPEEKQRRDREMIRERLREMDLVITTAAVPGRRAPVLITKDMVEEMRPGTVIVDLAAETGGNCELTVPGKVVEHNGVRIHGPLNLPGSVPVHASQMYSRNMYALLSYLADRDEEGNLRLKLDFEDEITDAACVTHAGEIRHAPTREALEGGES